MKISKKTRQWLRILRDRFNQQKGSQQTQTMPRVWHGLENLEPRILLSACEFEAQPFVHFIEPDPGLVLDELNRFTIRIYLSSPTDTQIKDVMIAVGSICESLGCEIDDEDPAEIASWFKRLICRVKKAVTRNDVALRLRELERAIHIKAMDLPQAQADKKLLEGVSTFVNAIGKNSAVLQIGSVLLVKRNTDDGSSCVIVKTLTQNQLSYLEHHPQYCKQPDRILDVLSEVPEFHLVNEDEVQSAIVVDVDHLASDESGSINHLNRKHGESVDEAPN